MMRELNDHAFNAVSREKFIYEIYQDVDPLDSWSELELGTQVDSLQVQSIDSDVIKVEWFVNGDPLESLLGEEFNGELLDLSQLNLADGQYTITARAYDEILDFSGTGQSLDWWRLDSSDLEQTVSWKVAASGSTVIAVPEPSLEMFAGVLLVFCAVSRRRQGLDKDNV